MEEKKLIRKRILTQRDTLTLSDRKAKSHLIAQQVIGHEKFANADVVLMFASYGSEVLADEIMETALVQKKSVFFPKVAGRDMEFYRIKGNDDFEEGYRGIREPSEEKIASGQLEKFEVQKGQKIFVLMPGVVFDAKGGRIGYGGGFYDRYLEQLEMRLKGQNEILEQRTESCLCKCAIAFQCQMVQEGVIKKEEHDILPDYIITEEKMYQMRDNL